jgi:hypothetical protein
MKSLYSVFLSCVFLVKASGKIYDKTDKFHNLKQLNKYSFAHTMEYYDDNKNEDKDPFL